MYLHSMAIKMTAASWKALPKWQRFYRFPLPKVPNSRSRNFRYWSFEILGYWTMKPRIKLFWEPIFSCVYFLRFSSETIESWRHRFFQNWRSPGLILNTHCRVVGRPVVSNLMTSPFSDSIVFSVHTRKQRFQKASFSNRSTLESVFGWLRPRWSFSAF